MSVGTPSYLLGKLVTVSITPQDVDSNGAFTNNAFGTQVFHGVIEQDEFDTNISTQNYTSTRSFNANPVPVEMEGTYSITEIMKATPRPTTGAFSWNVGNFLERISEISLYHKINVTAYAKDHTETVTGTVVRTWDFYGLLTNIKRNSPKAKNTTVATFKLISVGNGSGSFTANPALGPAL